MNEQWKNIVINFYKDVEKYKMSEVVVAKKYAELWWTGCDLYAGRDNHGFVNYIETNQYKNLALLNRFEDKFNMCKRTLLISDTSILWETGSENISYCIEEYREPGDSSYVNPHVYNYSYFAY